jgi:hypothetical protein
VPKSNQVQILAAYSKSFAILCWQIRTYWVKRPNPLVICLLNCVSEKHLLCPPNGSPSQSHDWFWTPLALSCHTLAFDPRHTQLRYFL